MSRRVLFFPLSVSFGEVLFCCCGARRGLFKLTHKTRGFIHPHPTPSQALPPSTTTISRPLLLRYQLPTTSSPSSSADNTAASTGCYEASYLAFRSVPHLVAALEILARQTRLNELLRSVVDERYGCSVVVVAAVPSPCAHGHGDGHGQGGGERNRVKTMMSLDDLFTRKFSLSTWAEDRDPLTQEADEPHIIVVAAGWTVMCTQPHPRIRPWSFPSRSVPAPVPRAHRRRHSHRHRHLLLLLLRLLRHWYPSLFPSRHSKLLRPISSACRSRSISPSRRWWTAARFPRPLLPLQGPLPPSPRMRKRSSSSRQSLSRQMRSSVLCWEGKRRGGNWKREWGGWCVRRGWSGWRWRR